MKVIALHLPQFHECEDNNNWWGKGFTEWSNVRKAVPLYEGHLQPRIPLNGDYYDLLSAEKIVEQMRMASEYGINGFCFYHYWFCGKKLLEKPVENLITKSELPIQFMLCWANEPWTRRWDGNFGSKQILIDQSYGDEEDWRNHFLYLLDFFRHDSYIKINGRPVIAVYRSANIDRRREMFSLWNDMAREHGFAEGLYFLNTHKFSMEKEVPIYGDAIYDFEPFVSMQFANRDRLGLYKEGYGGKQYFVFDFAKVCERMIKRKIFKGTHHNLGFFTGFDNSPRVGDRVGILFENNTPDMVEWYFRIQYHRGMNLDNDFMFINAWNEWGEGAILEPDEKYGYGYLEAIRKVVYNG